MFPISTGVAIYFVFIDAFVGMAIGALTGAVANLCLRVPRRGTAKNGLLGSLGFFVGYLTDILVQPHCKPSFSGLDFGNIRPN
jgi:hypothetical protein